MAATCPRRALVVEDQALLSELVTEGLTPNFEVLCAATVTEGIELVMAEAFVVLLDCVLPGETMWQIVLEADGQEVPVVLKTGHPAQMKAAEAGARPFIFKPFSLAALKAVLEDAALRPAPDDTPLFVGRSALLSEPDPSGAP
jgi:DNA-binding response OmpR family regulator